MPKPETFKRYYPNSKLSGEKIFEIAEWLKKYLNHNHISADNHILKAIISWEERTK